MGVDVAPQRRRARSGVGTEGSRSGSVGPRSSANRDQRVDGRVLQLLSLLGGAVEEPAVAEVVGMTSGGTCPSTRDMTKKVVPAGHRVDSSQKTRGHRHRRALRHLRPHPELRVEVVGGEHRHRTTAPVRCVPPGGGCWGAVIDPTGVEQDRLARHAVGLGHLDRFHRGSLPAGRDGTEPVRQLARRGVRVAPRGLGPRGGSVGLLCGSAIGGSPVMWRRDRHGTGPWRPVCSAAGDAGVARQDAAMHVASVVGTPRRANSLRCPRARPIPRYPM